MTEQLVNRPWACVLTPRGRGAIAAVRVWGEGALAAASGVFRPARGGGLDSTAPGRPRLGRIGRGLGDEVVAVVCGDAPPEVEIQCHGGSAAVEMVLQALATAGVRLAEPTTFALHAAGSPIRAAALEALARASTLRAAEILLEQAQGALDVELDRSAAGIASDPAEARERLDRSIARGRVGLRLISGWRVVIAGRPNVGKSRLLNALAGYRRAIVDPAPGTTRDVLTAAAALEGWPVELVDTAGVRASDDAVEKTGIERAVREHRRADLLLKVFDRSRPLEAEDRRLIAAEGDALVVVNKADLPAAWAPGAEWPDGPPALTVSAESGEGLDALIAAIARRLVPVPPEAGAAVPFRAEQIEALRRAEAALARGDEPAALAALRSLR